MIRTSLAALALLSVLAAEARADGFIRIERRPQQPAVVQLAVLYHRVNVKIADQTATTEIDQVFRNPNNRVLEGTYIFPLPEDSAISNFVLYVNGQPVTGELLDRDKARQIYEDIVRSQKDPALLEYVGRDAFRASIFPIPALGDTRIRLSYSQLLRHDAGMTVYRYPLNTEKFSSAPLDEVAIVCDVTSTSPLGAIYSPSHVVDVVRKGETTARVAYEARRVTPDKDFFLYVGSAGAKGGMTLATHLGTEADGTFLVLISPQALAAQAAPVAKDVIFVLDTSGSMGEGQKLAQAQRALRQCLGRLRAEDRFGLVAFSTEARAFREALVAADATAVQQADAFVAALEPRGGTAIQEALDVALKMLAPLAPPPGPPQPMPADSRPGPAPERPAYVVFVTDGAPTIGERDPDRLIDGVANACPGRARIFVMGVGEDLNTYLLDKLADRFRGAREYVTGKEDIEGKVSAFYDKIAFPVLTDVRLEIVGLETLDVYPKRLPDLFRGAQLAVLGRYRGKAGAYAVRLTGNVGGQPQTHVFEGTFSGQHVGGETLPRLWAVRKIGYLLEEIRLRGETPEVKAEVVRLSKQYGVMTPYTSFLVLEDEAQLLRRGPVSPGDPGWGRTGGANGPTGPASGPTSPAAPAFDAAGRARAEELREAAKSLRSDSGAGISGGRHLDQLKEGKSKDDQGDESVRQVVRHVGTKTFYKVGDAWVDATFTEGMPVVDVVAFSDAYLALARENPDVAKCLALGERVTVVVAGKAYRVV